MFDKVTKVNSRSSWKAQKPKFEKRMIRFSSPVKNVQLAETGIFDSCSDELTCSEVVLSIQKRDIELGLNDIQYNFLVDGKGVIYEGRGWDVNVDDFKVLFTNETIVIGLIGNRPDEKVLQQFRAIDDFVITVISNFINDGIDLGKLSKNVNFDKSMKPFEEKLFKSFIGRNEWSREVSFESPQTKLIPRIILMESMIQCTCTTEVLNIFFIV